MPSAIQSDDSSQARVAKLLPADITAAFLSAKAGLVSGLGGDASGYVVWTALAILVLSIPYFIYVSKITNWLHILFLCLSFIVFAISIANVELTNYFRDKEGIARAVKIIAIVLPVVWAFIISQIFLGALGSSIESKPTEPKPTEPKPL